MDDLVAFLTARLDEDEAAAKGATGGPWKTEVFGRGGGRQEWVVVGHTGSRATVTGEVAVGWMPGLPHDGEHIARHDPVRVLREVGAKRAILADWQHCSQEQYAIREASFYRSVLHLAAVYADHPDYRAQWKP